MPASLCVCFVCVPVCVWVGWNDERVCFIVGGGLATAAPAFVLGVALADDGRRPQETQRSPAWTATSVVTLSSSVWQWFCGITGCCERAGKCKEVLVLPLVVIIALFALAASFFFQFQHHNTTHASQSHSKHAPPASTRLLVKHS